MEITGKVHCFFEQSGTFKNEFIKLDSPAADYCILQNGYLPTLATAKVIAKNIKDINEAMMAVGGAVVCGWLWTATVQKENDCAFVVSSSSGDVGYEFRFNRNFARAVSAFHFQDFEF